MAYDAKLSLRSLTTSTATATGTGVDLHKHGTPKEGMAVRVTVSAVSGTSPTLAVKLQHSDDNTTFTDLAHANPASITAAGIAEIRFSTPKRYVRTVETIGGTSPSFAYKADVTNFAGVFPE